MCVRGFVHVSLCLSFSVWVAVVCVCTCFSLCVHVCPCWQCEGGLCVGTTAVVLHKELLLAQRSAQL